MLVSTGGVAVATALGFLVARTGLAPVHRLTGAVEHVAATNDLSSRITVNGRDEIARLAQAFNAMLAALQSSRAAQRLLVEDAGHELRTPLTSLRANIELLIRADEQAGTNRTLSAEDRAGLLRDLDAQTAELTQLVGELVELAREESGAEPVERVDLADLVELSTERIRQRWPEATFVTELDPVAVTGRPASLERMVANLLDNAAKWSPEQSPVRVRLRAVARPPDQRTHGLPAVGGADRCGQRTGHRRVRSAVDLRTLLPGHLGASHARFRPGTGDRGAGGGAARRHRDGEPVGYRWHPVHGVPAGARRLTGSAFH